MSWVSLEVKIKQRELNLENNLNSPLNLNLPQFAVFINISLFDNFLVKYLEKFYGQMSYFAKLRKTVNTAELKIVANSNCYEFFYWLFRYLSLKKHNRKHLSEFLPLNKSQLKQLEIIWIRHRFWICPNSTFFFNCSIFDHFLMKFD